MPIASNSPAGASVGATPAGSIIPYGGIAAPAEWLLCDGAAVSRTAYDTLFAIISTLYGPGNGTTTFNLPDLRGRAPVGLDGAIPDFNARGKNGGVKTVTLDATMIPAHTHTIPQFSSAGGSSPGIQTNKVLEAGDLSPASVGGGLAHDNMSPYQITQYIIKT